MTPTRLALLLLLALLCASCVHRAEIIHAPNPTAMIEHTRKLAAAVASARTSVQAAGAALAASEKSQSAAVSLFDVILPKLNGLSLDRPSEFALAVQSIQDDMRGLRELLDDSTTETRTARAALTAAGAQLELATAEKNEAQKAQADYIAQAESNVTKANASEVARAKLSSKVLWYQLHWWGSWIALGVGLLASGAFAVFRFLR